MISMKQIGPELDDGHNYESAKTENEFVGGKTKLKRLTNITELRQLARYCSFTNTNDRIGSQLISHCQLSQLRKRVFKRP